MGGGNPQHPQFKMFSKYIWIVIKGHPRGGRRNAIKLAVSVKYYVNMVIMKSSKINIIVYRVRSLNLKGDFTKNDK